MSVSFSSDPKTDPPVVHSDSLFKEESVKKQRHEKSLPDHPQILSEKEDEILENLYHHPYYRIKGIKRRSRYQKVRLKYIYFAMILVA